MAHAAREHGAFATVPPLPYLGIFEKVLGAGIYLVHTLFMATPTKNARPALHTFATGDDVQWRAGYDTRSGRVIRVTAKTVTVSVTGRPVKFSLRGTGYYKQAGTSVTGSMAGWGNLRPLAA